MKLSRLVKEATKCLEEFGDMEAEIKLPVLDNTRKIEHTFCSFESGKDRKYIIKTKASNREFGI